MDGLLSIKTELLTVTSNAFNLLPSTTSRGMEMSNPHQLDNSHLKALQLNLSNERSRIESAKTQQERELRAVWVRQLEREIEAERAFLGFLADPEINLTDEELLAELQA